MTTGGELARSQEFNLPHFRGDPQHASRHDGGGQYRFYSAVIDLGIQCSSECRRQLNPCEIARREEVVFARFINDTQLIVLFCSSVRPNLVDLASLKRNFVAVVSHTHDPRASF